MTATTTAREAITEKQAELLGQLRDLTREVLFTYDDAGLMEHTLRLLDNVEDKTAEPLYAALEEVFERWSIPAVFEHCRREVSVLADPEDELRAVREAVARREERRLMLRPIEGSDG